MTKSVKQHNSEVLKDVFKKRAKHIDALQVLDQELEFLKELQDKFGLSPSKEEKVVLAKYHTILQNKVQYLAQLLEDADMNFTAPAGKVDVKNFHHMKDLYNITVLISEKVDKDHE